MIPLKLTQQQHPAFSGCFDWHSSVHGQSVFIKLLKLFPDLPVREEIIHTLNINLTYKNVELEIHYFNGGYNKTFERIYEWA
jgi:hypothetical protein